MLILTFSSHETGKLSELRAIQRQENIDISFQHQFRKQEAMENVKKRHAEKEQTRAMAEKVESIVRESNLKLCEAITQSSGSEDAKNIMHLLKKQQG